MALLIFLLMATYINGVLAHPIAERLNWWLHSAIILVFPHLILRSKHFHILMAPIDIFFRTERLADLEPLNLDIEELEAMEEEPTFGLETLAVEGGADDGRLIAGKRFGSRLFVEYGYGLIDKLGTLLLRYQLSDRIILESRTGTVSNFDVLYSVKKK